MLIDAGGGKGDWNVGKWVLFPELTRRGILRLDSALLTHPDADHGMGFLGLFPELVIGTFLFGHSFTENPKPLLQALWQKLPVTPKRILDRRLDFEKAGVRFSLFSAQFPSSAKTNDRSVLLRIEYHGCSVLFTGDIEARAEQALLSQVLPTTFLKVAHHGSQTSSSEGFLKKVRARYGIVSCGRGNMYGHPHPAALRRLRDAGIELLRTDFHGAIEIEMDRRGRARCTSAGGFCGWASCS